MLQQSPGPLSRRTALGLTGLAAATGLAGCSVESTVDSLKAPTPSTPAAPGNADLRLASRVASAFLSADDLAPPPFTKLRKRQLRRYPDTKAATLQSGKQRWQPLEKGLVATFEDAAVTARDADLVRLFASMAAAQRQLLRARGIA